MDHTFTDYDQFKNSFYTSQTEKRNRRGWPSSRLRICVCTSPSCSWLHSITELKPWVTKYVFAWKPEKNYCDKLWSSFGTLLTTENWSELGRWFSFLWESLWPLTVGDTQTASSKQNIKPWKYAEKKIIPLCKIRIFPLPHLNLYL